MKQDLYSEIFKLKQLERTGWKACNVKGRIESDAELTFSMTILALEIINKNNLELDVAKVLKMIAYHELGEIDAGDITPAQYSGISKKEKSKREYDCIKRLAKQYNMPDIEQLWLEFENGESPEAQFVRKIDKYDAVNQSKIYAEKDNNPELFKEFRNNAKHICDEMDKLL